MAKFVTGNEVVIIRKNSAFFGKVGVIDQVNEKVWDQTYWVKIDEFDNRPMRFYESELARVV
jgi:hypothetical protein